MQVVDRFLRAQNAHDLDALVSCFAENYSSQQPTHPKRAFTGSARVRENWSRIFARYAAFEAVALRRDVGQGEGEGQTVVAMEVEWKGWVEAEKVGRPGLWMRGVVYVGVEGEEIVWGRLYVADVEEEGTIEEMVGAMVEEG
mmetsp:Transcript_38907/g.95147  ORF Transcript_38907/g.95147 Transcript_38907/m.95147 type:complete len:142 (-) Transcript_38907:30-455(-)